MNIIIITMILVIFNMPLFICQGAVTIQAQASLLHVFVYLNSPRDEPDP